MSTFRVITFALMFILAAVTSGSEPTLTPQTGILLLRNGQVLKGEITRAGDYFVVMLTPTSEIRLPATEVETPCKSFDDAYLWKLQRLDAGNQSERINLAEWCLRQGLIDAAEEQFSLAQQQNADHPRLKNLADRLKLARERKSEPEAAVPQGVSIATVGSEQLERTVRELPPGSIEKFAATVQPILLNRCSANNCHGPNSKTPFTLLRPALGQVPNRRFSQRNLYSTLRFVDRADPLNSPLLLMPQKRHGGTATPVLDERSRAQLIELITWVELTTASRQLATVPQKIEPQGTLLSSDSNPQSHAQVTSGGGQATATSAHSKPTSTAKATDSPPAEGTATATAAKPYQPRDPFDPEQFNRRFFR